jgi:hypothetical protein
MQLPKSKVLAIGRALIEAIEAAKHEVQILKVPWESGNSCELTQPNEPGCQAACYREIHDREALREKLMALLEARTIDESHPAMRKFPRFADLKATLNDAYNFWARCIKPPWRKSAFRFLYFHSASP